MRQNLEVSERPVAHWSDSRPDRRAKERNESNRVPLEKDRWGRVSRNYLNCAISVQTTDKCLDIVAAASF